MTLTRKEQERSKLRSQQKKNRRGKGARHDEMQIPYTLDPIHPKPPNPRPLRKPAVQQSVRYLHGPELCLGFRVQGLGFRV